MAFVHGKSAYFAIDDAGDVLRDLSAFLNSIDFPRDVDVPETTTFGNDDRTYIAGLRNATFSVSGFFDPTATTGPDAVLEGLLGFATARDFEYAPEGNTTGNVLYTGVAFLTSYNPSSPVDGPTAFSADFQISGAVTRGTVP